MLTADRGNKRLEYFTVSGAYHSTIEAKEITAPCNADIQGDHVLVPDLDGPLVVLDQDNRVVSVIEVGRLFGRAWIPPPPRCHLAPQRRRCRLHLESRSAGLLAPRLNVAAWASFRGQFAPGASPRGRSVRFHYTFVASVRAIVAIT